MSGSVMLTRRLVALASGLFASLVTCGGVTAQSVDDYPRKMIKIVVPYAPGGTVDTSARVIADALGGSFRVPVIVENRPGGGGSNGTGDVAKAPADGYTLLFGSPIPILLATRKNLPFTAQSFAAVASVNKFGHVLAVAPSLPVKTISELVAYARLNPGKLNYATTGFGAVTHLGTELFSQAAGIRAVPVPFRGNAEAMTALMTGDVQFTLVSPFFALPLYNTGKIGVVAAMAAKRSSQFPAVPAISEVGYRDLAVEALNGLVSPAGTPKEIVEKLNRQIQLALRDPKVVSRLSDIHTEVVHGTAQEYAAIDKAEMERWNEVVRKAGIQLQ